MSIRFSLLALILSAFSLLGPIHHMVAAQDVDLARFTPVDPGNRWEYSVEQVQGTSGPGSFLRYEVEHSDTLIGELQYSILRIEGFDADTTLLYRRRCAFYIESGATYSLKPLGDERFACDPSILFPREYFPISPDDTIRVGDRTYIVEATTWHGESHSGTGGAGASHATYFATDIGAYLHDTTIWEHWAASGGADQWIATLTYAEINGVSYGSELINTAVERPPGVEEHPPRISKLYPNPFQHEIRFEVEGLQPGPGYVEVFDLIGRRIFDRKVELGRGATTLMMERAPSGVYVLRVTDAFSRQVEAPMIRVASP